MEEKVADDMFKSYEDQDKTENDAKSADPINTKEAAAAITALQSVTLEEGDQYFEDIVTRPYAETAHSREEAGLDTYKPAKVEFPEPVMEGDDEVEPEVSTAEPEMPDPRPVWERFPNGRPMSRTLHQRPENF